MAGVNAALTKLSNEFVQQSDDEQARHIELHALAQELLPQYGHGWNWHSQVTLKRQTLSRILYYDLLYRKIIDIPGVICEFGVQWGATLAELVNLRGIYEPFNHSRKIYGFDTFRGFTAVDEKDGALPQVGDYATSTSYKQTLEDLLTLHESFSPIPHIKKFELIEGDASETVGKWAEDNPHAVVAMAIFDMDVYKPTRDVMEKIKARLTRGSLLVFDELSCPHFPGETVAVQEVFGLNELALRRYPHQPYCAWAVYGE